MAADPEPDQIVAVANPECPVVQPDARGPEAAGRLEAQGWMLRIRFQAIEIPVGEMANCFGKILIGLPEFRRGEVVHSGRVRPER